MSRGWLIDTNIPNGSSLGPMSGVVRWLDEVDEDRVFLSVISLAEIRFGVERLGLAPGRRRTRLDAWLREEPPVRFERRIVPVDREVADACGRFVGASAGGRPRARRDGPLIATTCLARDLILATRNLADFDGLGIALHAP